MHQLVVKVGVQDTRLSLAVLVDVSASMRLGEPSKLRAAQRLAAVLGAIALLHGDEVTVHALADGRSTPIARLDGPRQVMALADLIEDLPEGTGTDLDRALADHARVGGRSDIAVLVSDVHIAPDELRRTLRTLGACAPATALLHVVSDDERMPEVRGPVELVDAETGRELQATVDDETAREFASRFAAFEDDVRTACGALRVGYVRAPAEADPLTTLLEHAPEAAIAVA